MKTLALPALFLLFIRPAGDDVRRSDETATVEERIDELVVEPLRDVDHSLWFRFSRALVVDREPELRLWTSLPRADRDGRPFVAFGVRLLGDEMRHGFTVVTGCYYPQEDAPYFHDVHSGGYRRAGLHPLFVLSRDGQTASKTRCRAGVVRE